MKSTLALLALAAVATACSHDAERVQHRDIQGNYASTAKYNAMERDEFNAAMVAGLADFDARLESMKKEAVALGPDAVDEYQDAVEDLLLERKAFAAEFERHRAMMSDDWRSNREDVAEQYVELRENLDQAYEEVVEEA